jgi:hypothetical protein
LINPPAVQARPTDHSFALSGELMWRNGQTAVAKRHVCTAPFTITQTDTESRHWRAATSLGSVQRGRDGLAGLAKAVATLVVGRCRADVRDSFAEQHLSSTVWESVIGTRREYRWCVAFLAQRRVILTRPVITANSEI